MALAFARPSGADRLRQSSSTLTGQLSQQALARAHAIRVLKVVQALELDDTTRAAVAPILRRHDHKLLPLLIAEQRLRDRGRLLANAPGAAAAAQGESVLDGLVENRQKQHRIQAARLRDLRAVLSPQKALALFELMPGIDREMQRRVCSQGRASGVPEGLRQNPFE